MKTAIKIIIHDALENARQAGELELSLFPEIVVEKPKDEKMGDFSTNVAMTLARSERKNPKVIAESVARYLKNGSNDLSQVEIAGPGFINLKMSNEFFLQRLRSAVKQGDDFGHLEEATRPAVGDDQRDGSSAFALLMYEVDVQAVNFRLEVAELV